MTFDFSVKEGKTISPLSLKNISLIWIFISVHQLWSSHLQNWSVESYWSYMDRPHVQMLQLDFMKIWRTGVWYWRSRVSLEYQIKPTGYWSIQGHIVCCRDQTHLSLIGDKVSLNTRRCGCCFVLLITFMFLLIKESLKYHRTSGAVWFIRLQAHQSPSTYTPLLCSLIDANMSHMLHAFSAYKCFSLNLICCCAKM